MTLQPIMRPVRVRASLSLLAVALAGSNAIAGQGYAPGACQVAASELELPPPPPLSRPPVCQLDRGCLQVDWSIAPDMEIEKVLALHRFDETRPLRIHTSNVNRLRFRVVWSQKVVEQSQAFEAVSTLFEGASPLLGMAMEFATSRAESGTPFDEYLKGIEIAAACLADVTARMTDVVIDRTGTENRRRLSEAQHVVTEALPVLLTRRLSYIDSGPKLDDYAKLAQRHDELIKRVADFVPLARLSLEGESTVMPVEQRNTVVALAGQAVRTDGTAVGTAVTARYFVAWHKPVLYHVGVGYGRFRDFGFKQVRTLSGRDVFATTSAASSSQASDPDDDSPEPELAGYLTWELLRWGSNERYGLGLTAGTGLQSVARSLYVGGTLRVFSRLLVTGGVVAARASRGSGAVVDSTTAAEPTGSLFSELRQRTDKNPFWSVSFKVY